jgi:nucleoside-diphosphate-sugar epimerase
MDFLSEIAKLTHIQQIADKFSELKNRSVLVTGAYGLIASTVVDVLMCLNQKYGYAIEVYALCRNEQRAHKRFGIYEDSPYFHYLIMDICEKIKGNKPFDYIIHAACNAHPLAYSTNPIGVIEANIIGTKNCLEYIKQNGGKRLLFVSSSEVYGNSISAIHPEKVFGDITETDYGMIDPLKPRSCYAESKRAAESICIAYKNQFHIDITIARPGFIYGAVITEDNSRADAQFLRNAINHQDIVMKSSGNQIRSYCYVLDAALALLTILLEGACGEAYNIANCNSNVSIYEFAATIAKNAGVSIIFEDPKDIEKKGYSTFGNVVLSSDKLMSLGWNAIFNLNTGVAAMLNHFRSS